MKKRIWLVALFFMTSLMLSGCEEKGQIITDDSNVGTESEEEESLEETADTLFVYVCGAVQNPGVYELDAAARVFQAIEAAGGMKEEAAKDSMNLAESLTDGQQIYVLTVTQQQEQQSQADTQTGQTDSRLLNINTATAEQLMTLPGIGQSKASEIISYREEKGPYSSTEDIMNITGIKEGVYTKIKDKICVN